MFDSKATTFTPKNRHIVCTYCKETVGLHRLPDHLLAKKAGNVKACALVPDDVQGCPEVGV